jgi:hypothetical protein
MMQFELRRGVDEWEMLWEERVLMPLPLLLGTLRLSGEMAIRMAISTSIAIHSSGKPKDGIVKWLIGDLHVYIVFQIV